MAYQVSPNATVIGSTTAGADGNVSQFHLPGGISTMISGIGVYPTIHGIKERRDKLIETAMEIINKFKPN